MRILILGAGAVGSFLGHRLARASHDVTLVARSAYVRAVQEHGLCLYEGRHTLVNGELRLPVGGQVKRADRAYASVPASSVVHPEAVESIEHLPRDRRVWDLAVLTVKVYDTHSAAEELAAFLPSQIPLLLVQNGVGGEELVREVMPDVLLISGVITLSISVTGPASVRLETTRGGLHLAAATEGQPLDRWATLFTAAGLRTAMYPDYRALKWSKLLLNILGNAIPAILDMTPGAVFSDPKLFAVERAAFLEAAAVMNGLGLRPVGFPGYPVPLLVLAMKALPPSVLRLVLTRLMISGRGDKRPSLHMDLAGGRRQSEVLYLNGAVATHAQQAGVMAPVNGILLDTLMGIITGDQDWTAFRGQPERLLAELRGCGR